MSASTWSRLERGMATRVAVVDLARALAVVGLDLHLRAYLGGAPLRDAPHAELLERLRSRLGSGARWNTEVPLPGSGDRRAWDALIIVSGVRVGVEAETRVRDTQALQRRLSLKRRDGGVDHVVLLLADSRHNRVFVRDAPPGFLVDFPVSGRAALRKLERGEDPGGSAIVLL